MPDDTQRSLGRLEADMLSSQRQRAELFDQVAELREDMHKGFKELRELMAPMSTLPSHIHSHCEDLKKINNYVQQFKGVMWSGRFVWAALVVVAGTGYALFKDYQKAQEDRIFRIERAMPRSFPGLQ